MRISPPKNALKFLRWFCREDCVEEIEGDLTELFEKQVDVAPGLAKRKFILSVLKYFRPEFIKSINRGYHANSITMFKHNFLITYRNYLRYKSSFFINLIGLSSGLACALLIYLWVNDELQIDQFHKLNHRLFQVMTRSETVNGFEVSPVMAPVLAETLSKEFPEVEYAVSEALSPMKNTLSAEDKLFKVSGGYADKDYFQIFSYDLIQGNKARMLAEETSIVISEELARKLFNTTANVIGRSIDFESKGQFLVSGIFTIPRSSSVQFDFILPFNVQFKHFPNLKNDWSNSWTNTFVVLKAGASVEQFNSKILDLIKNKTRQANIALFLRPATEAYLYGNYQNGIQAGGRIEYVRLFSIIAVFILVIACINFMNLATAKASRRLKEVGIKKAIGAKRKTLVYQYFVESLFMAFLALGVSILIVLIFLPMFNEITGKHLTFNFDFNVVLAFLAITLVTGLLAGSYPALYLSSFNPVSVLKGKLDTSLGEVWTRKGLIVFQFVFSVLLIVGVMIVYKQMEFVQNQNLGYTKDNIIYFDMEPLVKEHLDVFLSEAKSIDGVTNASSIFRAFFGDLNSTSDISWEGKSPDLPLDLQYRRVHYDLIEVLRIEMKEGRSFNRNFSDQSKIILNEEAINKMGLQDPVGKKVQLWGREAEILGVVKNFHFQSLHEEVKPLFFYLAPERTTTVMIRLDSRKVVETLNTLQTFYTQFTQGMQLDFKFLDEEFQAQYRAEKRVAILSRYFAGLGILISCLGLFGVTAFMAERRSKEISIRKILGASDFGIVRLLSDDFTKLVLIAIVLALPVSYLLALNWLSGFAYRIDLQWWSFASAGVVVLLIAWFTIGIQTIKSARINPVQQLKQE